MAQCELWVSAFPHNGSCPALLTVPLIFLFMNQYFSLSLLFLVRFLAQNFAPHVETSAWCRFTLWAGVGSVSHQELSIHIQEQESCFQFASCSQWGGEGGGLSSNVNLGGGEVPPDHAPSEHYADQAEPHKVWFPPRIDEQVQNNRKWQETEDGGLI